MTRLSIPLSVKPGNHRIAVDTVDLQQTTSLESATTSLTVSSTYANILKYHIQGMPTNKFGNAGLKSEIYKEFYFSLTI